MKFAQVSPGGAHTTIDRTIAIEHPVAIEVNGLGYAVMMATPDDLIDLGYGFALSERLIDGLDDLIDVETHDAPGGTLLKLTTSASVRDRVVDRVRHRVSESSCGLCGIENLEQAMRPLPRLAAQDPIAPAAIFRALGEMRDHQPLNAGTGAVHAALACDRDGAVLIAREDVGRHNAFDKTIGAMLRAGRGWDGGFALLSSRCSYELIEKAALAGCGTLVTVSAATTLALARAEACGVRLLSLARADSYLEEAGQG